MDARVSQWLVSGMTTSFSEVHSSNIWLSTFSLPEFRKDRSALSKARHPWNMDWAYSRFGGLNLLKSTLVREVQFMNMPELVWRLIEFEKSGRETLSRE